MCNYVILFSIHLIRLQFFFLASFVQILRVSLNSATTVQFRFLLIPAQLYLHVIYIDMCIASYPYMCTDRTIPCTFVFTLSECKKKSWVSLHKQMHKIIRSVMSRLILFGYGRLLSMLNSLYRRENMCGRVRTKNLAFVRANVLSSVCVFFIHY